MKTKPKRNKPYVAKKVLADPTAWAIAGVHLMPDHVKTELRTHLDGAYAQLAQGVADNAVWCSLMQSLNIAEELSKVKIGNNLLPHILAGQDALLDIARRMLDGGKTCRGSELAMIREALDMHKIQIDFCTQAEFSRCVRQVVQRTKSSKAMALPGAAA